ncbi:hypothetical protein K461DRAFT_28029 [Myriangium duriaei CBS 260.36]|uniref:Uncharacterized protein n=1 Tax=Myriangium duriaei CBS 260.36 TaxID=1168546 RepID=A0A9P4J9X6_9PEZI|nr:hypothetical protein K461DRAFT_28029 [Myriangium duriaei CBS 260.36]
MSFDPDSTNDNILDNNHQWPYCQIPSPYAAYQHVVSEAHAAVEYDSTGHTTLNTPSYGGGSFIPVPPYRTALKGGFFPRSQSNHQTVSEPCLKGTSQTRIALENFAPLCPARQILASHPQPMRTGVIKSKKLPKHSSSARMIRFRMCDEDKRLRYVIFLLEQLHKDIICSSLCRLIDELIPKRKSRLPYQSSFQGAVIEAPFFWPKGIEWKSVHHQKKEVVLPLMAYLLRLYWSPELWMAFNHDITDFALQHVEWPKLVTRVLKSTYEERARSTKLKHAVQLPVIEDLRNFIIAECHLVQNGFGKCHAIFPQCVLF